MTVYDFDRLTDRTGTYSYKWDQSEKLFGHADVLPLWVADMDFEPPREVVQEMIRRAEQGVYGYTIRPKAITRRLPDGCSAAMAGPSNMTGSRRARG